MHHRFPAVTRALLLCLGLAACQVTPAAVPVSRPETTARFDVQLPLERPSGNFTLQAVEAPEPPAGTLETVSSPPVDPLLNVRFEAAQQPVGGVQIPEGAFQLRLETGSSFAVIDGDARDGSATLQIPTNVLDLYLKNDAAQVPPMCQTSNNPLSDSARLNALDQLVLDKANSLIAQGQGQCVYLPPLNQRQNANCNSTSSGLQCSGPLNKTISAAQCPEIAVYGGAMNLNNTLSSKLFVATQNNLTLNQSARGVLVTRGDLNTSLNGSHQLEGVVVGARSNNFNMGGTTQFKGLYAILNNGSLSLNANENSRFEGALCSTGSVNRNRNGNASLVYNPASLASWIADVPALPDMLCPARSNFYTQTLPQDCSSATPSSLTLEDSLYGVSQTITDTVWTVLPRRPVPVPADWQSAAGEVYVLNLNHTGPGGFSLQGQAQTASAQVPAAVKVIPAVDCVKPDPDGGYIAYLSYRNLLPEAVTLPVGSANGFAPEPFDRGQPTRFETGQSAVFPASPHAIRFSGPDLSWTLGARVVSVSATDAELQCPVVEENRSPELLISNVQLSDTGESILGKDAPGSIVPDYAGKTIELTISGTFKDADQQDLQLSEFLFTLEPPLIQQSFIGREPNARILLDDSILLEPVSVTGTEIRARLHTEKVPDLYLKGLHRLAVEQGDWYTDALVKVGDPVHTDDLMPQIDSVEVLRNDAGKPMRLRLTGKNFMVYPKFSYTTIDGEFGFGFQTEVLADGSAETVVHIPNPETFDLVSEHLVILATPFGVVFEGF